MYIYYNNYKYHKWIGKVVFFGNEYILLKNNKYIIFVICLFF